MLLHLGRHGLRDGPLDNGVAIWPLEAVRLPVNEVDQPLQSGGNHGSAWPLACSSHEAHCL